MKSSQKLELLIVFTRYPEPGRTKTRLARTLGDLGAAHIQKKLTGHALSQVRQFIQLRPAAIYVYYDGGSLGQMTDWLGPDLNYRKQRGKDLGQRMAEAFAAAFRQEFQRIVITGTDCPGLQASHMEKAFELLRHKDLILGPASDGGYYLIGLSRNETALFRDVAWGSETVLEATIKIAVQKGLSFELLETLSDVDRPEDLIHINHHSNP